MCENQLKMNKTCNSSWLKEKIILIVSIYTNEF